MVREIKIVLSDNPSEGEGFTVSIDATSEFYTDNLVVIFKADPEDLSTDVTIGANVSISSFNLFDFLSFRYRNIDFITVVENVDGATIIIDAYLVTSSTVEITGDIIITHEQTEGNPFIKILSRSPYFVEIQPSFPFDQATMELKIYRGDVNFDLPLLPNYTLSKLAVQAGQEKIVFDIHKIANDFVKNNYSPVGTIGSYTTNVLDSVWIEATITAYYIGDSVATVTRKYFAVDGFGYHTELANPPINKKVLSSINNHVLYIGNSFSYPLYFLTEGLVSITVNGNVIPFSFNQDISNQVVGYVNIYEYTTADSFSAVFVYEDETVTHNFTIKTECIFDTANVIFKNKYGFWQSIPFNKLSKKTVDIENSTYLGLNSEFGSYSIYSHGNRTFNVSGKERITLNTDFIPEEYNELFKELLLSEFIYIQQNDSILPANLVKKSLDVKTKLNNKLIQYSMDLEYSYNIMNQVI